MQPFMVAISPHHSHFLASHFPDSVSPHPRSIPLSKADQLEPTVAIVAVATPPSPVAIPPLPGHFLASRQLACVGCHHKLRRHHYPDIFQPVATSTQPLLPFSATGTHLAHD